MVSKLALGAIWGYQRFISPYKGFRCAHSVLHGGTGCSGHAKRAIGEHGLWGAIPAIKQRLRDCKTASETLRANCSVHANWAEDQASDSPRRGRKRNKQRKDDRGRGCVGNACDCTDVGWCAIALPAFLVGGTGSGGAQTPPAPEKMGTPVDGGGGADGCGGLDCAVPSCDGCDGCGGCDCSPSCG